MQMVAFRGLFKDRGLFFQEAGQVELCFPEAEQEVFTDRKLKLLNLSSVEDDCISFLQTKKQAQVSDSVLRLMETACTENRAAFLAL